jgi:hypothetical protein
MLLIKRQQKEIQPDYIVKNKIYKAKNDVIPVKYYLQKNPRI